MAAVEFPELDALFSDDVDVVSAQEFATFLGIAYASMRAFCIEYGVPKLANSFAITKDRGEELLEAINESLEAAEAGANESDSEEDHPDHDPDDEDCSCPDCCEDLEDDD